VNPDDAQPLIWMKRGQHTEEAEHICARNRAEHGGRLVGEPSAWTTPYSGPEGVVTFLEATGRWWPDYMAVHGGWVGPATEDELLDFFDPQQPI